MTIAERLDRLPLTSLHVSILILCTIGLSSDIAEIALSSALAAVFIAPPYQVPQNQLSLLLAAVFAGGALGAPIFGWVADRWCGRRVLLQVALALLCGSSICASLSPDLRSIIFFRFISGLALGAYPPLTSTYLAELLPPRRRGSVLMICVALAFLAAPAVIFMMRGLYHVLPFGSEAWRWALASGAMVAAASALMLSVVPESPRWLVAVGRAAAAERACRRFERSAGIPAPSEPVEIEPAFREPIKGLRLLVANQIHRNRLLVLCSIYIFAPWSTYGFLLLSVPVLVQKGFQANDSLLFAGASMMGPTIGIILTALVIDLVSRRLILAACAGTMIVLGIAFAASTTLAPLVLFGILFNLMGAVFASALQVYSAELFPTDLRSSATAFAWGIGRAMSALVPICLLPLLTIYGLATMMAAIISTLIACLVLFALDRTPSLTRKSIL